VRKCIFCDSKHLQDVSSEEVLDLVKVNLRNVFAHILLRGIIDKDIDFLEPVTREKGLKSVTILAKHFACIPIHMLLDRSLARLVLP
jgi:hypothetical protein